jgi:hypothetical protein
MLQPKALKLEAESACRQTRKVRYVTCPATLVVHSRSPAVRFRILSTDAPSTTTVVPVSFPAVSLPLVSFSLGHRMCQKAMDCNGDETSDRCQR